MNNSEYPWWVEAVSLIAAIGTVSFAALVVTQWLEILL